MEWVKCDEELPENSDDVLVFDDRGNMAVSCRFFLRNEFHWEDRNDQIRLGTVMYWMKLPDAPKDEK